MRVFVAGGTGAIGRHLIPVLIANGHQVTASTRSAGKSAELAAAGAAPVVMDGLDRDAVLAAVQEAAPEVIAHQMTSLGITKDFRSFDEEFAVTNELRTTGNPLAGTTPRGRCPAPELRICARSVVSLVRVATVGPVVLG